VLFLLRIMLPCGENLQVELKAVFECIIGGRWEGQGQTQAPRAFVRSQNLTALNKITHQSGLVVEFLNGVVRYDMIRWLGHRHY